MTNKIISPADKEHEKLRQIHKEIKDQIKINVFEIFTGISHREIDIAFNKITQELPSDGNTNTKSLTDKIVEYLVEKETKLIHIREGDNAIH